MTDAVDGDLVLALRENQDRVCEGAAHAVAQCVGGQWEPCTAEEYEANDAGYGEERCDDLDNDCNGAPDDGSRPPPACYTDGHACSVAALDARSPRLVLL